MPRGRINVLRSHFHIKIWQILWNSPKDQQISIQKLQQSLNTKHFPELELIQHFEGNNGPDGIKRKSPNVDEPQHFCDPDNPDDQEVAKMIESHYQALVESLKQGNSEKAAFEASWMAHAIVDGLTPAHQLPYVETIEKLQGDKQITGRFGFLAKRLFLHDTIGDTLSNNWKFWGANGLIIMHSLFEVGVAAIGIFSLRRFQPISLDQLRSIENNSITDRYDDAFLKVADMNMFEKFNSTGWTAGLARSVREELLPELVEVVSLYWAKAIHEAGLSGKVMA